MKEIIKKYKNKNVNDLKKKLEHLINSPKLVNEVGLDAKKYVLENYSWVDIVNSVEHVYQELLSFNVVNSFSGKAIHIR